MHSNVNVLSHSVAASVETCCSMRRHVLLPWFLGALCAILRRLLLNTNRITEVHTKCIYAHIDTPVYICKDMKKCVHTRFECIYTYTHVYIYIQMYIYLFIYIYVYIIYMCVHM